MVRAGKATTRGLYRSLDQMRGSPIPSVKIMMEAIMRSLPENFRGLDIDTTRGARHPHQVRIRFYDGTTIKWSTPKLRKKGGGK